MILSVDGHPAAEQLAAEAALASGSPQWRLVRARRRFGTSPVGSKVALHLRRGGTELDVTVTRGGSLPSQSSHPMIERFDDGVYYIDLGRAPMAELDPIMDRLASAPGIVFDMLQCVGCHPARDSPGSYPDVGSDLGDDPCLADRRAPRQEPVHRPSQWSSFTSGQRSTLTWPARSAWTI